ncbi:acyl- thioesterase ii [Ophiostoma piceae UAMH 11346]|uniref:Acyl-thioesterase ii n=1 Tax=Ophiostoma piceae (strain UAMH 11346) TaxID=1262450 RepID=S3BLQ7_OPHP1|nr:acyl- thioesterase ii [Ophiostoma piceae UAMH 11346]
MPPPVFAADIRKQQLATEHALSLTETPDAGKDVFQNAQTLWHPLWARGVFGGALVAQSLMAAQQTTPAGFFAHCMHCLFVRPAQTNTPVSYHVNRVRDGKSVASRTVQVQQNALPPTAVKLGPPSRRGGPIDRKQLTRTSQAGGSSLYECVRVPRDGSKEGRPELTKLLQWVRVRSTGLSTGHKNQPQADDSIKAHLAALAYVTDHYFIGTALRVNDGGRFASAESAVQTMSTFDQETPEGRTKLQLFKDLIQEEVDENTLVAAEKPASAKNPPLTAEFMVSLDHTIYFHEPTAVHADDWMLFEAESPWSGHERGLVIERIWNRDGVLIATCVQEGMIRSMFRVPLARPGRLSLTASSTQPSPVLQDSIIALVSTYPRTNITVRIYALVREESINKSALQEYAKKGVKVVPADFNGSVEAITSVFKGIDVVTSAIFDIIEKLGGETVKRTYVLAEIIAASVAKIADYAKYLGYLLARDLCLELKSKPFVNYCIEVLNNKAHAVQENTVFL